MLPVSGDTVKPGLRIVNKGAPVEEAASERMISRVLGDSPLVWLSGLTLLTTVCVWGLAVIAPWDKIVPDYVCYWAAGELVATGHSPYDVALQSRIQHEHGWDRVRDGLGKYEFLPYYYPPWFAACLALLVPLGFEGAKIAWFAVILELLLVTGYLLRDAVPGLPWSIPLVTVPIFALSVVALFMGQTSIPMLFLVAVVWRLLERGNDRLAGVALACLTTKPQLAAPLVLALLIWCARQRRWRVLVGFMATLAALSLAGAWIVPDWPIEMLRAAERTPPPTAYFPWIGTTWLLALKTAGLRSWGLWMPYLAVALPFLGYLISAAFDRSRPLADILSLGAFAPFILAPYGRHYDFPILLIPLFVLISRRLSEKAGTALLVAMLILPYINLGIISAYRERVPSTVRLFPEFTCLWIPVLVMACWFATEVGRRRSGAGWDGACRPSSGFPETVASRTGRGSQVS